MLTNLSPCCCCRAVATVRNRGAELRVARVGQEAGMCIYIVEAIIMVDCHIVHKRGLHVFFGGEGGEGKIKIL